MNERTYHAVHNTSFHGHTGICSLFCRPISQYRIHLAVATLDLPKRIKQRYPDLPCIPIAGHTTSVCICLIIRKRANRLHRRWFPIMQIQLLHHAKAISYPDTTFRDVLISDDGFSGCANCFRGLGQSLGVLDTCTWRCIRPSFKLVGNEQGLVTGILWYHTLPATFACLPNTPVCSLYFPAQRLRSCCLVGLGALSSDGICVFGNCVALELSGIDHLNCA
ncbi:hypothetical protein HOY82DRAFT_110251 [Tuber indicum]|nr:hypothetical protein HOY82DRAFT_110251 [Tuber indicum]